MKPGERAQKIIDDNCDWIVMKHGALINLRGDIVDHINAAVEAATSHIPTPQFDLDTLIQRNEERKQIKIGVTSGPWTALSAWDHQEDVLQWYVDMPQSASNSELLIEIDATFIAHARNDTPENDIDQLLALIADLQAALQELS